MAKEEQKINLENVEAIRGKLDELNRLMYPYQLAYVDPVNDCVGLEKNAHYMDKSILDRLTANVEQDGFLSQLPFAMKRTEDGKYLMLSGNHRLKAAIKAHLPFILIQYIDEVNKDTQIKYQLSHNTLVGKDDMQMLKAIYDEIESIEAKEFTGLNGINFVDVNKVSAPSINDGDIELTEMTFLFTESRKNDIEGVLAALEKHGVDENTTLVVGSFEEFIKCLQEVKKKYDIHSKSIAFGKMVNICKEYLAREEE